MCLDVLVPEVVLQGAGVVAVVGELEPACMPKHVWVDGERHLCDFAKPCHEMMEAHRADRPATFGNEHVGLRWVFTAQSAQGADFITTDGMDAWRAALGPADVQPALVELDLMPLEAADLACSQPMTIGDQDHGGIAMAVSAVLAGSIDQMLDLALCEVTAFDCECFDSW